MIRLGEVTHIVSGYHIVCLSAHQLKQMEIPVLTQANKKLQGICHLLHDEEPQ